MDNCIFSGHCTEYQCDQSCSILAETSYLLERNGIAASSKVYRADPCYMNSMMQAIQKCTGSTSCFVSKDTIRDAEMLTYLAICRNWKGSRLHCVVYNMKYSKYLDMIKQSWNSKSESAELEYMRIWSSTAKILVVSNIDYVNFKDFESQTLLSLIQERQSNNLTTIVVSPPVSSLVGQGPFAERLKYILKEVQMK